MDGWDWLWGTLMMILFWGGLAAVIIVAVRAVTGASRGRSGENGTRDSSAILDARYARGEISEEEYAHRKTVLGHANVERSPQDATVGRR